MSLNSKWSSFLQYSWYKRLMLNLAVVSMAVTKRSIMELMTVILPNSPTKHDDVSFWKKFGQQKCQGHGRGC
jgi:hypothetical protein